MRIFIIDDDTGETTELMGHDVFLNEDDEIDIIKDTVSTTKIVFRIRTVLHKIGDNADVRQEIHVRSKYE